MTNKKATGSMKNKYSKSKLEKSNQRRINGKPSKQGPKNECQD
jgi:hypothetical protein